MFVCPASENWKNIAQIGAWLAAGAYFLVKLLLGYFVINLSLDVTSERQQSSTPGLDYLAVSIDIVKGDRGTFHIHDAQVVIIQGKKIEERKLDFHRVVSERIGLRRRGIRSGQKTQKSNLNFSPGETAHSRTWFTVNSHEPCMIEAAIVGTPLGSWVISQWRASAVSLPLKPLIGEISTFV
jgi:hypothetical protein